MQALRRARFLTRLVLAWFALAIGVAVASPVVQPKTLEMLCTGTGVMKLVTQGEDGSAPQVKAALDCPLCATTGAPPPVHAVDVPQVQPLAHAVQSIPAARLAALVSAPLPARGPPASLVA